MFDDVLDKLRERGGLEGLAGGLVGDNTGVEVDADDVALADGLAGGGAVQNRQADVDGVAVMMRAKLLAITQLMPAALMATGACSREEPQPKFSPPTIRSPCLTRVMNVLSISSMQWLASSAALWVFR